MKRDNYNLRMKWIIYLSKYFLLTCIICIFIGLLLLSFGGLDFVTLALLTVGQWLWRLAVVIFCLIGIAIFLESWD